jgi:hypothetical protein
VAAEETGPGECVGVIPKAVFDTSSRSWVPADQGSFSCDEASGYWLSPKYFFDQRTGWYKIIPPEEPKPAGLLTAEDVVHTQMGDLVVGSQDYQVAKALGLLDGPDSILIDSTGSNSNNTGNIINSGQTWVDLTSLVNVFNTLQSVATSGDVNAVKNTQVGDATSGPASVLANVINLLASAWSWANGDLSVFMENYFGDHNGDITLAPSQAVNGNGGQLGGTAEVGNTGPDSNNQAGVNNSNVLDVNAKSTGNIVNNVDLLAQSGDTTADSNTSAGNVSTGNATAAVNIINLISSLVSSGNSFFGILNIFGSFSGDILFPEGFLNGLTPSGTGQGSSAGIGNTGADSNNQAGINNNNQANYNNSTFHGVNNNINTVAGSGDVNGDSNTTVGNMQSGDASTTQSLFNLSNTSIFGDNAVLVLVNVLGHWVGKIMTLPGAGDSQSALLTGNATVGVNGTGPGSNNEAGVSNNTQANVNQSSVGTITNNVNVEAQSGDASAQRNTRVGDVMTGDAHAAAGVANIFNSVLNVKNWFGVLVINVFGEWFGDVNNDTSYGEEAAAPATGGQGNGIQVAKSQATPPVTVAQSKSLPQLLAGTTDSGNDSGGSSTKVASTDGNGKVLTAGAKSQSDTSELTAKSKDFSLLFALSAIIMLLAGALASIDRKLRRR